MKIYNKEALLEEMATDIKTQRHTDIDPLQADKYILSSCWQKSVRRGQVHTALSAASAFWHIDRQAFWRRMHLLAIEDVCAGDTDTVIKVLTATSSHVWRRRVGDLSVGLYLTQLLCGAVKSRMGDELFTQAERAPEYKALRHSLVAANETTLAAYAGNEDAPLIERALSLWYLSGTRKYPSDAMPARHSDPAKGLEVLRSLDVPTDLVEACISVTGRTAYPLAILMPLIWQTVQRQPKPLYVWQEPLPPVAEVNDIPVYAVDMFTRAGQTSFRHLKQAVPLLKPFSVRQIGLALFYIEGCRVNKLLTSDYLEEFRRAGEIADIEGSGLSVPEYLGLRDCLIENIQTLHDIRCTQVQKYLAGDAE